MSHTLIGFLSFLKMELHCFRFTAFTTAGTAFGTVIAMPASTYLCELLGWESVFYVFGGLGVVWFLIWCLVIHDGPDVHPRISRKERDFLEEALKDSQSSKPSKIPWLSIGVSVPVWAIAVAHITQVHKKYNRILPK